MSELLQNWIWGLVALLMWQRFGVFLFFNVLFCCFRDLLHNFPMYLCCRHQLWAVSLSTVSVWPAWWHWPWLWLVHVLRLGRPRPHPHCWFLLHPGSLRPADTPINLPQVPTREWHRLLKLAAIRRPTKPTERQQRNRKNCSICSSIHSSQVSPGSRFFFICVCVLKWVSWWSAILKKKQKKTEELKKYYQNFWSCACFVVVEQTMKWTMTEKGCKGNMRRHWKT